MTTLTLVPTYLIDLELTGDGNTMTVIQADDALVLELANVLRGPIGPAGYGLLGFAAVTDGATVSIDLSQPVGVYTVTIEGNRTLTFTGGTAELDRKRLILEVTQGTGGSKTLTPDASVGFGVDLPSMDLSTGEGVTDALGFIYRHASGKCHLLALNRGA